MDNNRGLVRWGAIAGILAAAAFVASGLVAGTPPKAGAPSATVLSFLTDKRSSLLLQAWLISLGAPLLLWFAAAVRDAMQPGDDSYLPRMFYGGMVVSAVAVLAAGLFIAAITYASTAGAPAQLGRAFYDGATLATGLFAAFAIAPALLAFAWSASRSKALPAWTAVLAVIALAVNLAQTFTIFVTSGSFYSAEGYFGFVQLAALVVWIVGTAIAILTRPAPVEVPVVAERKTTRARGARR